MYDASIYTDAELSVICFRELSVAALFSPSHYTILNASYRAVVSCSSRS